MASAKLVIGVALTIAAPALADATIGQPLEGPFATRNAACEAILATRGTCTTYRAAVTASASAGWSKVEVGAVGEQRHGKTRHFGLFVEIDKQWFARFLGTDGSVDTELFPPCEPGGGVGSCAPSHADMPSYYKVPKLSWVNAIAGGSKELVLFYPTSSDVGFREHAPTAELVQVCGLGTAVPSCTETLIVVTRSRARAKSPADLFAGDGNVVLADDPPIVSHLKL